MKPKVYLDPELRTYLSVIRSILEGIIEEVKTFEGCDIAFFEEQFDIPEDCSKKILCVYLEGSQPTRSNYYHLNGLNRISAIFSPEGVYEKFKEKS